MPIHNPLHPGEIIYDILIENAGLSIVEAAKKLGVNRTTLSRLLNGHAGISAEMALRLSKLLPNTDMTLWMNLQRDYDIWVVMKHATKIHIKPLKAA
jgi:addiction module HigA family antidote